MCEFAYMKLYPADLIADTLRLSRADFGSYTLLLMAMWRDGGRLRSNADELQRIARVRRGWPEIWGRLLRFFVVSEDGLWISQKRLMVEMEEARGKSGQASDAANRRWSKQTGTPKPVSVRATNVVATGVPSNSDNPLKNNNPTYADAYPRARATPYPDPDISKNNGGVVGERAASPPANRPEPAPDEQAKVAKGFEALAASLDRVVATVAASKPGAKPRPIPKPDEPIYSPAEMRALERLFPTIPDLPERIAELVRWSERQGMKPNEQKLAIKRRLDKDVGEQRLAAWNAEVTA